MKVVIPSTACRYKKWGFWPVPPPSATPAAGHGVFDCFFYLLFFRLSVSFTLQLFVTLEISLFEFLLLNPKPRKKIWANRPIDVQFEQGEIWGLDFYFTIVIYWIRGSLFNHIQSLFCPFFMIAQINWLTGCLAYLIALAPLATVALMIGLTIEIITIYWRCWDTPWWSNYMALKSTKLQNL